MCREWRRYGFEMSWPACWVRATIAVHMGAAQRHRKRERTALYLLQHPPQRATTNDMQVEMRHLLHAVLAGIGDRTEPAIAKLHAGLTADLGHGAVEIDDLGIAGLSREMIIADIGPLGDHQHMHRRLRLDILKSERMLGLQHGLVRDLAAQDLGKDVLVVIGIRHGRPQSAKRWSSAAMSCAFSGGISRNRDNRSG